MNAENKPSLPSTEECRIATCVAYYEPEAKPIEPKPVFMMGETPINPPSAPESSKK